MQEDRKKEIAAVGSEEFTLGFELAGVNKTFNPDDYTQKIQELTDRDDLGIVIVDEKDLEQIPARIRRNVEESVDPVVVALSEEAESERLQEKIKRAIGADITQ
ncbi:MAG: V-type ATP synthase subunit F [Candidatus Nanohalobium sp.]